MNIAHASLAIVALAADLGLLESERRYPTVVSDIQLDSRYSQHTNDLRYESNDSREMLNGSSLRTLRWLDELEEPLDLLDQKALRSGGEGCARY